MKHQGWKITPDHRVRNEVSGEYLIDPITGAHARIRIQVTFDKGRIYYIDVVARLRWHQ